MVGQTLGHYRILRTLGQGGMGVVYEAEDARLARRVALKVLPEEMAARPERLERFEREARAVAALNHPNIVTVYSVEEADGVRFLTMERVEGKTLAELIPPGGLRLDRFLELAVPLAEAMHAAHERGITHRDLKPANVMVDGDGRVKVLDFGLAKLHDEPPTALSGAETLTGVGHLLGTAPYMSPEQAQSKAIDHRSDIFSLGVVLYEMASGQRPFRGESAAELITAIVHEEPPSLTSFDSGLPSLLGRIIHHCLVKDPKRRCQSALDLRNELLDLKAEVASGTPLASSGFADAGAPKWPWAALAAAVVLALAAGYLLVRLASYEKPADAGSADRPRIVVLPFDNLGSPDDEYFAAGMTEEIASRLAAAGGLSVISRKSALRYAGTDKTLGQIGEELDVAYALEGTVRWAPGDKGSRVRISPQLIRIADDTHLWTEVYDRVIDDVFEVQADIAGKVTTELGITLLESEREAVEARPTENLEAYQAYLRGKAYAGSFEYRARGFLVPMFQRAVELDPGFVSAWAELSQAHAFIVHLAIDRSAERAASAKRAADRALELAPDSPEAHLALGYYYYYVHKSYERALEELAIAANGRPNDSEVLAAISFIERRQGYWEESLFSLGKALRLSPLDAEYHIDQALTYCWMREYQEADRHFDRGIALDPNDPWSFLFKTRSLLLWKGTTREARDTLEAMPDTGQPMAALAWWSLEILEGRYQDALDRITSMPEESVSVSPSFYSRDLLAAWTYELLGETSLARESLGKARVFLEEKIREEPEHAGIHSSLGQAYASLGRKADAIREGRRAVELLPVSRDAMWGPDLVLDLARIYTRVGEYDAALNQLEVLLSIPAAISQPMLRLDPAWAPLRENPRFQALMVREQ